jgi:serine/threonine protein kinase/tetratricopeptide (TPR) repeat protein
MLELKKGLQLADRYTLVRRLGGDSDTHTWLAKDRLTSASVALKITAGDLQSTEKLRAEWQASIRLMHAHIVRAFEFHADSDVAIFSQQFIDGPDLGVLTGQSTEKILGPVGLLLQAVDYLHRKGMVHRDIKASNVLLDSNGAPYLSDFGVSAAVGNVGAGGSLIAQSPQSLAGRPATAPDDIFAIGSLVYELLPGQPPWPTSDMADAIVHAEPPPLVAADGSALPKAVVSLVSQMLDKDDANRPTANDVAEQLKLAGYPPRTASIHGKVSPRLDDEIIESVHSIQPVQRQSHQPAEVVLQESAGLSQKMVGIALAVLVVILLSVVFILPNNVSDVPEPAADVSMDEEGLDMGSPPVVVDGENNKNRSKVYVDPEVRRRMQGNPDAPNRTLEDDDEITFSENAADYSGLNEEGRARFEAESTLGELLSALEVLEGRGIALWASREQLAARDLYQKGDKAYLEKDFAYAEELYLGALTVLEPLYERIEPTFEEAYAGGIAAFDAGDRLEALRLFELAVAITSSHPGAKAGYERARNLEAVLMLVDQGLEFEEDLDLDAAQSSFEQAIELDSLWQPAHDGLLRVQETRTKIEFDTRMTEGFEAIVAGEYLAARAAFRMAKKLIPESNEPADGLLQVDQGMRLQDITTLELEAQSLEQDEHWDAVVRTYEEILKIDSTLTFASDGLQNGRQMSALHNELEELIAEPDRLSVPSVMQKATTLVVNITTRQEVGSRLAAQRDELSRLLKRAATPLAVPLVSDNVTEVSIYKVGRLGNFMRREINLRPGTYVVVGSRPGFRDVRMEFRVAPEIDMEPVVVQCEEQI